MNIKIEHILPALLGKLPLPEGTTAETVTSEQIIEAIDSLVTEEEMTEMENRITGLTEELVNHDLEKFASVITDREAIKTQLVANRAETIKLLAGIKSPKAPIYNREAARPPESDKKPSAPPVDQARLVNEIKIRNRCTFAQAWEMARAEKPELFLPAAE